MKKINNIDKIENEMEFILQIIFESIETQEFVKYGYPIKFITENTPLDYENQYLLHCHFFNQVFGKAICVRCQSSYIGIINKVNSWNSISELKRQIDLNIVKFKKVNDISTKVEARIKKNVVFVEYDCPFLGYRNIIAPIIYNEKLIGVFLSSPFCLEHDLKDYYRTRDEFITKNNNLLNENLSYKNLSRESSFIKRMLINGDPKEMIKNENISNLINSKSIQLETPKTNEFEYETLLNAYAEEIKNIQNKIETIINEKVKERLHKSIEKVNIFLENHIMNSLNETTENIFWSSLEPVITSLCKDFKIFQLTLFSNQITISHKHKPYSISEYLIPKIQHGINNRELKFNSYEYQADKYGVIDNIDFVELNLCISSNDKDAKDIILYYNNNLNIKLAIAISMSYEDKNDHILNVYKTPLIKQLLSKIFLMYATVINNSQSKTLLYEKSSLENNLKVLKHEILHHNEVLNGIISNIHDKLLINESDDYRMKQKLLIETKNFKNIYNDLLSVYYLIYFSCKNIEFFDGNYIVKKTNFWFLKDIVFKCYSVYMKKLSERGLFMELPTVSSKDENSPQMYNDKILVELVFNNLIDNAVKYAFLGTKIIVRYDNRINQIALLKQFSITNYGFKEENIENLFDLYYSGDIATSLGEVGQGIGLAVCKKIVEDLLQGELRIEFEKKVSNYNIGYMVSFLKYFDRIRNLIKSPSALHTKINVEDLDILREKVEKEYVYLNKTGILQNIVTKSIEEKLDLKNKLFDVIANIQLPTYEIVCTVRL